MKKTFSLFLSVLIHIMLITIVLSIYFFTKPRNEPEKSQNRICINLTTYSSIKKEQKSSKKVTQTKKTTKKISQKKIIKRKLERPKVERIKSNKERTENKIKQKNNHKLLNRINATKQICKSNSTQTKTIAKGKNKESNKKKSTEKTMTTITKKEISYKKRNEYNIELLKNEIIKNLYYPRKARKRHIQGIVKLSFTFTKEGKITNIKILNSNSKLLQNAAIKTLLKIQGKVKKPKENLRITLPIVFRLNNN